jgi:hypothetical protein
MTEMTTKMILYVRARRCALDKFCFPFAILFCLFYPKIQTSEEFSSFQMRFDTLSQCRVDARHGGQFYHCRLSNHIH